MEYNNTDIVNIKYQLIGANDLGMREMQAKVQHCYWCGRI